MRLFKYIFMAWLTLVFQTANASIEIVELKHRLVGDIKPLLDPHTNGDATISGQSDVLVIKSKDKILLFELIKLVKIFDTPLKQFMIELKKGRDAVESEHFLKTYHQTQSSNKRQTQTLRLLEGRKGRISLGETKTILAPIYHQYAGIIGQWQQVEASSYFEIIPRYTKSGVILELSQQLEYWQPNQTSSKATSRLQVSVNVTIGEWNSLGGVQSRSHEDNKNVFSTGNTKLSNEKWSIRVNIIEE